MKDLDKHLFTVGLVVAGVVGAGFLMANVTALSGARAGYRA